MKKNGKIHHVREDRRRFVTGLFTGFGYLGLRSFLLGLPPSFLTQRALAAGNRTFLVFSTRDQGCPVNANVPLTYQAGLGVDHPAAYATPAQFNLGDVQVSAAQPWADLPEDLRSRFQFFHYSSLSNAHPEADQVIELHAALKAQSGVGPEMLPSAIAQELALDLGTIETRPMLLGDLRFSVTYNSVVLGKTEPTSLRDLFSESSTPDLQAMMKFRDQQLDLLYSDLKANGSAKQKRFLDDHALSRDQARQMSVELGNLLMDIQGNRASEQEDQMIAAAAMIASKAAPVAVVSLNFGGDNHQDDDLSVESQTLQASTTAISNFWQRLKALGVQDQTTFALQNVFGRTLKKKTDGGRDHNSEHAVMLMFGPNVKPGVTGDMTPLSDRKGASATGINSMTGRSNNADVPKNRTLASAGKTLMKACGIAEEQIDKRISAGKIIRSAVS